jgi:hypothetical protein
LKIEEWKNGILEKWNIGKTEGIILALHAALCALQYRRMKS